LKLIKGLAGLLLDFSNKFINFNKDLIQTLLRISIALHIVEMDFGYLYGKHQKIAFFYRKIGNPSQQYQLLGFLLGLQRRWDRNFFWTLNKNQ